MPFVYDERTDEILFRSDCRGECVHFILANYPDDDDEDFPYIWVGE